MKAVIIDDEPIARKGISLLADQITNLDIIAEFGNPLLAQEFILTNKDLDLIFLDVEMPGITGINYLKSMPPRCHVILTTAYQQYALEAFELDVVDYLLKPIRIERFAKAVQKVRELIEMKKNSIEINDSDPFIYIKSDRKYVKLALTEVIYIKGLKDYVIIHTEKNKYMTAMNVGTIGRQLPVDKFARVSKSYIINVAYIKSINLDMIDLGVVQIPLGATYKDNFIKTYVRKNLLRR